MKMSNVKYQMLNKGQAVLIVMLVMAVALTIGLAIVSRTTTDIKISQQQEESARAFSAAEAGIEELLKPGAGTTFALPDIGGGASVDAKVTTASGYSEFLFPDEILPGQTAILWLAEHSGDDLNESNTYSGSSFNLCWNGEAVEVSVYYKQGGEYKVTRGAYDPNRTRGNNFADVDSGGCLGLARKKTINFSSLGVPGGSILLFANLKPYYSTTKIGVVAASGKSFPSQGKEIESTGTLGTIARKVRVFRSWPAPAAVFDYGLFSGGGLVKSAP